MCADQMKISLITDEISADMETAVELGTSWGVQDFELRSVENNRVPDLTDYQKVRIRELIQEYGIRIVAISPGLFKCAYPGKERDRFSLQAFDHSFYQKWRSARDLVKYHWEELLPASLAYAQELGARIIVVFSFQRDPRSPDSAPDEVVEILSGAALQAEKLGLQLAVEVEKGFWADTGARTLDLVRRVNRPGFGVNWDPGNAFEAGDVPYPDGYGEVRQHVRHVHFKDVRRDSRDEYIYAIEGEIDWSGQIEALAQDDYRGFLSIETHMRPKIRSAEASLKRLRRLLEISNKR